MPPDSILQVPHLGAHTDASSIRSAPLSNTITFQRNYKFHLSLSSTELRSLHSDLSSESQLSLSSSSTTPGIDRITGRAIYWVGEKMLNGLIMVDTRRRLWNTELFLRKMRSVPPPKRIAWILNRKTSVMRLLEDLLEISS
jgi:hypothetical protein